MNKTKKRIKENFCVDQKFTSSWLEYNDNELQLKNQISVTDSLDFFEKMNLTVLKMEKTNRQTGLYPERDLWFSLEIQGKVYQYALREWSKLIYVTVVYLENGENRIKSQQFFLSLAEKGVELPPGFFAEWTYEKRLNYEALFRKYLYKKVLDWFYPLIAENVNFSNISRTQTKEDEPAYLVELKVKRTVYQLIISKSNDTEYTLTDLEDRIYVANELFQKMLKQLKTHTEQLGFHLPYGYERQAFAEMLKTEMLSRIWNSKEYKLRTLYGEF